MRISILEKYRTGRWCGSGLSAHDEELHEIVTNRVWIEEK